MVGTCLDGKEEKMSALSVTSEIDVDKSKHKNKFVDLVQEKITNYEERKARMVRNADLRNGEDSDEVPRNLLKKLSCL